MVGMLDEGALFYLTLGGQMQGYNKIPLAAVHPGVKAAVYAGKRLVDYIARTRSQIS
jgi:hypothetical protein